jgi:hypothetical protein
MPVDDLASLFTERLALARIEYMVTGSTACIAHGEPRLTLDIDLVVELTRWLRRSQQTDRHGRMARAIRSPGDLP